MSEPTETQEAQESRLEKLLLAGSTTSDEALVEEELEPFILVRTGEMQLGVQAHSVVEIATIEEATPLPGAPRYILGLVLLKGRLMPVVSVPTLLSSAPVGRATDNTHLVVLGHGELEVAILANAVEGIVHIPAEGGASRHGNIEWISHSIEYQGGLVDRVDVATLLQTIVDGQS